MSARQPIELTIDGRKVSVPPGTTIFDAARMNNIEIPTLCNQQNETPVGVCRVCAVDVGAQGVRGIVHPSGRSGNGRQHRVGWREARATYAGRAADV